MSDTTDVAVVNDGVCDVIVIIVDVVVTDDASLSDDIGALVADDW